jgi:coenzyme F420-reducing hydrogenase delta subunit
MDERIVVDELDSAGEGERFAQVVRQFVETIRQIGPFPLGARWSKSFVPS